MAPDRVLDMAEALQIAHFRDGMDLNNIETYVNITRQLVLDVVFDLPAPNKVGADLAQEFAESRSLGLTSYPSLLIGAGDDLRALDVGYDPDVLVARIKAAIPA